MATDFGRREPGEMKQPDGPFASIFAFQQVFVPATDEEIAAYRAKHSLWLQSCAAILRDYHDTLNQQSGPPGFRFVAVNEGVRPGKDALITIEAKGEFLIMPPPRKRREDEEEEGTDTEKPTRPIDLPRPPTPPRGSWRNEHVTAFEALHRGLVGYPRFRRPLRHWISGAKLDAFTSPHQASATRPERFFLQA